MLSLSKSSWPWFCWCPCSQENGKIWLVKMGCGSWWLMDVSFSVMKSLIYIYIYIVSLKWQLARLEGKIMSTAIIDYMRSLFAIVWITTVFSIVCVWDLFIFSILMVRFAKYLFLWFLWLQHKAGKSSGSVLSLFERWREGKHFPNTPCLRDFFNCFFGWNIWNPLLLRLFSEFVVKNFALSTSWPWFFGKKRGMKKLPGF